LRRAGTRTLAETVTTTAVAGPGAAYLSGMVEPSPGAQPAPAHVLALLRALLEPTPLGTGPIRLESWNDPEWTDEQRKAYIALRSVAGLPLTEDP
jgi:hypothetical protein